MIRRKLQVLSLLLVTLLPFPAAPALAHIEKTAMPDSVAEMEYRILLEFKPEDTASRSLLGMALYRQDKLAEAEKEFRRALQTDPDHFDALDGLGLTLLKQNRATEAVPELTRARELRPDDILVHLHLGRALGREGNAKAARAALRTGLDLLDRQPPSDALNRQRQEFDAALQELPAVTANTANRKE